MGSKPIGISASRASAILGLNQYQTRFEVWQRMMEEIRPGFNEEQGFLMPPEPDNASIRWGNAFESAIVELASLSRGQEIQDREGFYFHEADEIKITCHIDGATYPDGVLHEGKTTSYFAWKEKWGEPGSDKVPIEYAIQAQHQMICTGAEECIISVLVFPKRVEEFEELGWIPNMDKEPIHLINDLTGNMEMVADWADTLDHMGYFHQYPIKANQALQKKLLEHYAIFWQAHIVTGKPPIDDCSYDDLRRMIPEPAGTLVFKDTSLFRKLDANNKRIKAREEKKEELKNEILKQARQLEGFDDEDAKKKWVFRSEFGEKLGQFDGKTFRVSKK